MSIPRNVRTMARDTYVRFMRTGKPSNYRARGSLGASVYGDGVTVVVSDAKGNTWRVPIAKSWLG